MHCLSLSVVVCSRVCGVCIYVNVCVYVCTCVCMVSCVGVCMCGFECVRVRAYLHVSVRECVYVCVCVSHYVKMHISLWGGYD